MCDVHLSQSLDYKNQLQYDKNAIITEHVNTRLARTAAYKLYLSVVKIITWLCILHCILSTIQWWIKMNIKDEYGYFALIFR